jgi:hypothetical protein
VTTVTQQPDFSTSETLEAAKSNYPTGPGFASAAFDGNDQTGYSVAGDGSVTFTFPSVTGGNFVDSDTTRSVLKFTSQGIFQVTDGGVTEFLAATGPNKGSYTLNLGSPEDFNQDVKFIAGPAGGIVFEVWWEHELSTTIDLTRDDDTEVSTSPVTLTSSSAVGYEMIPIKGLVARYDAASSNADVKALPDEVFQDLQERFLGEPRGDIASSTWYNAASYAAAQARYNDLTIALHFVVDRLISWPELEAQVAKACRTYAFYGPEGHTIKFIEDATTLEGVTPAAEFLLPGVPNPNVVQAPGAPLMQRTSLTEMVNTVRVYHTRNWLLPRATDLEERYDSWVEASNAESVALHGVKQDMAGAVLAWPLAKGSSYFNNNSAAWVAWDGNQQVQQLAQFMADRTALGHTRFAFETNGEVVGVERGDIVRVSYATATNVYRNVLCEVESVRAVPMNAHKHGLVCRTISTPRKGLTEALVWTDLYTSTADTWADRITSTYDRWDQYFGVP